MWGEGGRGKGCESERQAHHYVRIAGLRDVLWGLLAWEECRVGSGALLLQHAQYGCSGSKGLQQPREPPPRLPVRPQAPFPKLPYQQVTLARIPGSPVPPGANGQSGRLEHAPRHPRSPRGFTFCCCLVWRGKKELVAGSDTEVASPSSPRGAARRKPPPGRATSQIPLEWEARVPTGRGPLLREEGIVLRLVWRSRWLQVSHLGPPRWPQNAGHVRKKRRENANKAW